jgi:ketosteroid isomerase-like protein
MVNEKELLRRERAWVKAHLDMDLNVIEEILDEEYAQLNFDGTITGKEDLIESYKSGNRYWEIAESDPIRTQLMGETGLLFGKWRGKGRNGGQSFDYATYFLAVYRKREGKWKLVADASLNKG